MKIKFLSLSALLLVTALFTACSPDSASKEQDATVVQSRPAPSNAPLTITSNPAFDIRCSDVYSISSAYERKVEFLTKSTHAVYQAFKITVICDDSHDDALETLQGGTFTGKIKIADVDTGYPLATWSYARGGRLVLSLQNSGCNVKQVHDCVAWKIEDMNPISYAFCLASAPACYGQLWASCWYDVCVDHKIYQNPN